MDFKENTINLFSILALPTGQSFGLRGPDLSRGPLIEDPCSNLSGDTNITGVRAW